MITRSQIEHLRITTAVKIDDRAESRVEELQAEIRLRTGTKVTQRELLTRLIDDACESREKVIDSFRNDTVSLSEIEIQRMQRERISSGIETDEEDIDETLYS